MNLYAMPHTLPSLGKSVCVAALAALSFALASCNSASGPPIEEAPLYGATIGGPFELLDKKGQTVRWSDFEGQYRMVYFGFAYCPDICPTDVQRMMQGYNKFADDQPKLAENIQPIFITIDPERDTPEVVGEFAAAFSPKLLGLTGSAEQVKQAADNFRVFYSRGETTEGGGYLMDHSNIAILFGPDGQPIATLPNDLGGDAVAAELAKWVR